MIFYLQGLKRNWPGYGGIINTYLSRLFFTFFGGNKNPEGVRTELPGLKINRQLKQLEQDREAREQAT